MSTTKVGKPVSSIVKSQTQTRVTVRFAETPSHFHLIEVIRNADHVSVQIDGACDPEAVASVAAHIRGLGVF